MAAMKRIVAPVTLELGGNLGRVTAGEEVELDIETALDIERRFGVAAPRLAIDNSARLQAQLESARTRIVELEGNVVMLQAALDEQIAAAPKRGRPRAGVE